MRPPTGFGDPEPPGNPIPPPEHRLRIPMALAAIPADRRPEACDCWPKGDAPDEFTHTSSGREGERQVCTHGRAWILENEAKDISNIESFRLCWVELLGRDRRRAVRQVNRENRPFSVEGTARVIR